jgi:hypothetical protein
LLIMNTFLYKAAWMLRASRGDILASNKIFRVDSIQLISIIILFNKLARVSMLQSIKMGIKCCCCCCCWPSYTCRRSRCRRERLGRCEPSRSTQDRRPKDQFNKTENQSSILLTMKLFQFAL